MTPERFENRDLRGATFENCDLSGAVFKECLLFGSRIAGPYGGININGIDVGRLIWFELLRRYPDRKRLMFANADGARDAHAYIDELRARTLERCRALPEDQLQAPPGAGEWSIVANLRHILHAEDSWARRRAFGDASVSPMGRNPSFISDDDARASGLRIDEVLPFEDVASEMEGRHVFVHERFAGLTDDECNRAAPTTDWEGTVLQALREYLTHEWDHHWQIEQILGREP